MTLLNSNPPFSAILDHGYIKLIEHWGSDERIIEAARMSTGKGFQGWSPRITGIPCHPNGEPSGCPRRELPGFLVDVWLASGRPSYQDATNPFRDVREEPGDERLLRYLWDKKHHTPFEMAGAIFEIQAPIFVFREWHRHRTQSYNELSARYTPLPDSNYLPTVDRLMMVNVRNNQATSLLGSETLTIDSALEWLAELADLYAESERVYQDGLSRGIPKELARLAVTVGRYSRMRASANLRNWLGFMALRSSVKSQAAQWEIRQYADAGLDMLDGLFPRTVSLFRG